jgi:hypothetical protein
MLPGKVMSPRTSSGWFGVSHSVDRWGGCGGGACGVVGDAEGSSIRSTGTVLVRVRYATQDDLARRACAPRLDRPLDGPQLRVLEAFRRQPAKPGPAPPWPRARVPRRASHGPTRPPQARLSWTAPVASPLLRPRRGPYVKGAAWHFGSNRRLGSLPGPWEEAVIYSSLEGRRE